MALVPIFPLPNVVLFPGVPLPLHIFEPRYRAMVADALDADRRIGMALLQPGWESDYDGRPPIFSVACTGVIVNAARLDDGRYHLVLHGLERVRVVAEDHARPYRRATLASMPDPVLDDEARRALGHSRRRIETLLGLGADAGEAGASAASTLALMPDADFVHTLAQGLDLAPIEQQALLEYGDLALRAQALADLLEMRRLTFASPPASNRPH
jgi:Lon protease-like protein